jgi:glycosyltransferase involved in cell wall biosynthesis
LKILQLSSASTLGGGERHFADLSNALAARGHEVYAALRPEAPLRERLALPDARVITLPLRNALDVASASRLAAFARDNQIQIVHAHVARDYPLAAHAVRLVKGTRLVLTRHVPFALNSLHRIAVANVSRVIAVSAGVARKLREQGIFSPDKISVVPNGVDFDHYDRALEGFDREQYRRTLSASARLLVGTVGELSETKGQEDLLRAAASVVRSTGSARRVEFLIVGEDNSEDQRTRRRLERIVEEENLRGRVHFRGFAPDLPRLLAALDVYVSASRAEAFGLATVEAMICGAPVVATATDGSREIVEDDRTGRLVPVGNVEALAAALVELLEDERERERLGTNALHSVTERFSLKRMVEETERIYRSVLA